MKWCLSAKTNVVTRFDEKDAAEYWWSSFNKQRGLDDIKLIMDKPGPKKVKKKKSKISSISTSTGTSYGYSSEKGTCSVCGGTGGGGGNCYKCGGSGWA